MSTVLPSECFCSWCGKPDAPSICPCKRASFCSRECLKSAWSGHRLICTFDNGSTKTKRNAFSLGDLVEIQGLKTQAALNGLLAEIKSYDKDKDRYVVLLSTPQVKCNLIKQENLVLKVSATEAAIRSRATGQQVRKALAQTDAHLEFHKRSEDWLETQEEDALLIPQEIVNRIRNPDEQLCRYWLYNEFSEIFPPRYMLILLNKGLVDACLADFKFPDSIDGGMGRPFSHPVMPVNTIILLRTAFTVLDKSPSFQDRALADLHAAATSKKLGPLILLASTKKRRLFGSTEYWWALQFQFLFLVNRCCAEPNAEANLFSLPPLVEKALLEHLVFIITVDPKLFLKSKSVLSNLKLDEYISLSAVALISVWIISMFKNDAFEQLGRVPVPAGAKGVVGKSFASCVLDVFAKTCLECYDIWTDTGNVHLSQDRLVGLWEQLQKYKHIYFWFQESPALKREMDEFEEMGDYDSTSIDTFMALTDKTKEDGVLCFLAWSRDRMAKSPMG